jgi:hypothetical protein
MALYDPIRDGFREFNNLLLDSKQWDERHAAAEADKDFKWSVLESNLVQQEFQNEMAQDRLLLLQHGDVRAAAKQLADIKSTADNLEIANKHLKETLTAGKFNRKTVAQNQKRYAAVEQRNVEEHAQNMDDARVASRLLISATGESN